MDIEQTLTDINEKVDRLLAYHEKEDTVDSSKSHDPFAPDEPVQRVQVAQEQSAQELAPPNTEEGDGPGSVNAEVFPDASQPEQPEAVVPSGEPQPEIAPPTGSVSGEITFSDGSTVGEDAPQAAQEPAQAAPAPEAASQDPQTGSEPESAAEPEPVAAVEAAPAAEPSPEPAAEQPAPPSTEGAQS